MNLLNLLKTTVMDYSLSAMQKMQVLKEEVSITPEDIETFLAPQTVRPKKSDAVQRALKFVSKDDRRKELNCVHFDQNIVATDARRLYIEEKPDKLKDVFGDFLSVKSAAGKEKVRQCTSEKVIFIGKEPFFKYEGYTYPKYMSAVPEESSLRFEEMKEPLKILGYLKAYRNLLKIQDVKKKDLMRIRFFNETLGITVIFNVNYLIDVIESLVSAGGVIYAGVSSPAYPAIFRTDKVQVALMACREEEQVLPVLQNFKRELNRYSTIPDYEIINGKKLKRIIH